MYQKVTYQNYSLLKGQYIKFLEIVGVLDSEREDEYHQQIAFVREVMYDSNNEEIILSLDSISHCYLKNCTSVPSIINDTFVCINQQKRINLSKTSIFYFKLIKKEIAVSIVKKIINDIKNGYIIE